MILLATVKWTTILWIVLAVLLIAGIVALYFWSRKLEKQQAETQRQMDAMAQTVSALILDKKLLKVKDSGLPATAIEQFPWYAKRQKLPIVKAKIGPRIFTMIADKAVYDILPEKKECKIVISGLYITELKSVRHGVVPKPTPKKGLFAKTRQKLSTKRAEYDAEEAKAKQPKRSISEKAGNTGNNARKK